MMWIILLLAYFLFIFNWSLSSLLAGDQNQGWVHTFFGPKGANNIVLQATNYVITYMRGFASLFAALIIAKISHKKAALVALFCMSFALPAVWAPNFVLYLSGRSLFAAAGTMLIVFIQPIISQFFSPKLKAWASLINPWSFGLASLVAFSLFLNSELGNYLQRNWQIVASVAAAAIFVPLLFYFFYGKNFIVSKQSEKQNLQAQATYKNLIVQRETWLWVCFYGFWLVIWILSSRFVPKLLISFNTHLANFEGFINLSFENIFAISFFIGSLVSFPLGLWNSWNRRLKPYGIFLTTMILLSCIFLGLNAYWGNTIWVLVFIFLIGFFTKGTQQVFLYMPYEYPQHSAQSIAIFNSYLWGFGLIIYSTLNLTSASLYDLPGVENNYRGSLYALSFISLIIVLFWILSLLIRESRPQAPYLFRPPFRFKKQLKLIFKKAKDF